MTVTVTYLVQFVDKKYRSTTLFRVLQLNKAAIIYSLTLLTSLTERLADHLADHLAVFSVVFRADYPVVFLAGRPAVLLAANWTDRIAAHLTDLIAAHLANYLADHLAINESGYPTMTVCALVPRLVSCSNFQLIGVTHPQRRTPSELFSPTIG